MLALLSFSVYKVLLPFIIYRVSRYAIITYIRVNDKTKDMRNLITVLALLIGTVAFGQREQRRIDIPGVKPLAVGQTWEIETTDTSEEAYFEIVAQTQDILNENKALFTAPDINDSNSDYTIMSLPSIYDDIKNSAGEFDQVWILDYTEEYHTAMALHMDNEEMYLMVWVNVH